MTDAIRKAGAAAAAPGGGTPLAPLEQKIAWVTEADEVRPPKRTAKRNPTGGRTVNGLCPFPLAAPKARRTPHTRHTDPWPPQIPPLPEPCRPFPEPRIPPLPTPRR